MTQDEGQSAIVNYLSFEKIKLPRMAICTLQQHL